MGMSLRLPVWRRGLPVEAQPRCKNESRSDRLGKAEPFRTDALKFRLAIEDETARCALECGSSSYRFGVSALRWWYEAKLVCDTALRHAAGKKAAACHDVSQDKES